MRALTTIGIQEQTNARINQISIKYNTKTKEDVIIALLNVVKYCKLQSELKDEIEKLYN